MNHLEPFALGQPAKLGDVRVPRKIKFPGLRLVQVPKEIGTDGIQAHRAGHAQTMLPVLPGNARKMHLAATNQERPAVEQKIIRADGERGAVPECNLRGHQDDENDSARAPRGKEWRSSVGWLHAGRRLASASVPHNSLVCVIAFK